MKTITCINLCILILTILAPRAGAAFEPDDACPERTDDKSNHTEIARQWFGEAAGYVEMGRFGEAVGAYACSYRFVEHPSTLYNMGQAALVSGNDELAYEVFAKYLEENPEGEFAGKCRLRLTAIENRRKRQARESEVRTAEVPSAEAEVERRTAAYAAALKQTEKRRSTLRLLGIGSVAAGGACLAAGIGFQVASIRRIRSAERNDIIWYSDRQIVQSRQFQVAATALFASAIITASFGASLWVLHRKDTKPAVKLALLPAPGGLALTGRF